MDSDDEATGYSTLQRLTSKNLLELAMSQCTDCEPPTDLISLLSAPLEDDDIIEPSVYTTDIQCIMTILLHIYLE